MKPIDGLQIGELSHRVGVSTHTLRAWERRYGLLHPVRTAGGYRMYDVADEQRVRAVIAARDRGVPISVAVRQVLRSDRNSLPEPAADHVASVVSTADATAYLQVMYDTADRFDEPGMHAVLDDMLSTTPLGCVMDDVLMPFLRQLGQRWADGSTSVACEHFASQLIRRRLSALALAWGNTHGPATMLACPAGEQHDIALLCCGLLLGQSGWLVHYLGADTPATDVLRMAAAVRPAVVVLAATREDLLAPALPTLMDAPLAPICIGGAGATQRLALATGATLLPYRLQDAVAQLTRSFGHTTQQQSADPGAP